MLQGWFKKEFSRAPFFIFELIMRNYLLLLLYFCSLGCVSQKDLQENNPTSPYSGVVRYTKSSCKVIIEITRSENNDYIGKKIYALNLEPKFQKNGLTMDFDFIPSKAPTPEGCVANMVASLVHVTVRK